MNKKQTVLGNITIGFFIFIFLGCSSGIKKADIPNTANPSEEITQLNIDIETAIAKNIDVLAAKDFKKSLSWLEEAKSDQSKAKKQEEIINDLRMSRGYLNKAYQVSENRTNKAPGLFEARQFAIQAGARNYTALKSDFEEIDKDVSQKVSVPEKINVSIVSDLQDNVRKQASPQGSIHKWTSSQSKNRH